MTERIGTKTPVDNKMSIWYLSNLLIRCYNRVAVKISSQNISVRKERV